MSQMNNEYENIELSDPADSFSISSVVNPECSDVGVFCDPNSVWIPSTCNFFASFFQFYLRTVSHSDYWVYLSLLDFIFKSFDLSEIHDMLTTYNSMCGDFRNVVNKYYCGKSGRGVLPDIFEKYSLNTCLLEGEILLYKHSSREINMDFKSRW